MEVRRSRVRVDPKNRSSNFEGYRYEVVNWYGNPIVSAGNPFRHGLDDTNGLPVTKRIKPSNHLGVGNGPVRFHHEPDDYSALKAFPYEIGWGL